MSEDELPDEQVARRGQGPNRVLAVLRLFGIVAGLVLAVILTWKGRFYALLVWLVTIVVLLDTSVNVFYSQYEDPGSRRLGLLFWIATFLLGMRQVQRITADGRLVTTRPEGPLGKLFARFGVPGQLIVDVDMAAVLARRGEYTRVVGPGRYELERHERPVYWFDLRPQVSKLRLGDIRTADGLVLDVSLDARFQIDATLEASGRASSVGPGSREGAPSTSEEKPSQSEGAAAEKEDLKPSYRFSQHGIVRLVKEWGILYDRDSGRFEDWRDSVVRVIEQTVRDVAATWPLQDFFPWLSFRRKEQDATLGLVGADQATNRAQESARQRFQQELESEARTRLQRMGVRLLGIDVGSIAVPPEVQQLLAMPVKQELDLGWARAHEEAINRIAEGLQKAVSTIKVATQGTPAEVQPHLLLSLTNLLERIAQDFLQLTEPYREPREIPERRRQNQGQIPPGTAPTGSQVPWP